MNEEIRIVFLGKKDQVPLLYRTYEEQKALKDRWEKAHGINYQIPGERHV